MMWMSDVARTYSVSMQPGMMWMSDVAGTYSVSMQPHMMWMSDVAGTYRISTQPHMMSRARLVDTGPSWCIKVRCIKVRKPLSETCAD